MNGWQLDIIRDQMDTEAWEKLNQPDPCDRQMRLSAVSITQAAQFIMTAENKLADAMVEVFDTPMESRIGSFLDALQDLRCDLFTLADKYGRGERD